MVLKGFWREGLIKVINGRRCVCREYVPGIGEGGSETRIDRILADGESWPPIEAQKPKPEPEPRSTDPAALLRLPGPLSGKEQQLLRQSLREYQQRRNRGEE